MLNKIQSIKDTKVKTFKKKIYKIPKYNNEILINEANLFCDWYVKKKLPRIKKKKIFKRI